MPEHALYRSAVKSAYTLAFALTISSTLTLDATANQPSKEESLKVQQLKKSGLNKQQVRPQTIHEQALTAPVAPLAIPDRKLREMQREASKLFRNSKWNEAIAAYSNILKHHSSDTRALVERGICYCRVQSYNKAIEDFNATLKVDPKSDRAYQHRGYAFYHLGKFKAAIADESKAIAINPSNKFAYRDRCKAYAQLGQYDLAQKDFAVQLKLYRAAREYYAATEMQHNGQYSKALAIFENSEKENHGMFNPNIRRAAIYTRLGMYAEAVAVCSQFIKDHPKTFEGRKLRAINYLQLGEFEKATADADKALKLESGSIDPLYVKARVAMYNKNYASAIANYSAIIKIRPDNELAARLERADAYCALGDYNHAIADYDFLAKVDDKDETIFYHRAKANLKLRQFDKAISDLNKFVQLAPGDPLAYMSLAEGLFQAQRYPESITTYTKAIQLDAASPTLYESRAKAYDRCNDIAAAKRDRDKAHQLRKLD